MKNEKKAVATLATKTAKSSGSSKSSSSKLAKNTEVKLDKKNKEEVKASITSKKELKYRYPESCEVGKDKEEILLKRKLFRASVRRKMKSLEKRLISLNSEPTAENKKEVKALSQEIKAYREEVLL